MTWSQETLPLFFAIPEGISAWFFQPLGHRALHNSILFPLEVYLIGHCSTFLPLEGHPLKHIVEFSCFRGHIIIIYWTKWHPRGHSIMILLCEGQPVWHFFLWKKQKNKPNKKHSRQGTFACFNNTGTWGGDHTVCPPYESTSAFTL